MDTPHLKAELRGRDHAMILLGIGSAIIILWLLLHRKANVTNETINNEGGDADYPTSPWPDYVLQQVGPGSYSYDLAYQPGSYSPGDDNLSLSLPADNFGIENCACGCDDFVAPTYLPGPVPTLVIASQPSPQEVIVIKPNPPAPKSGMVLGSSASTWN